MQQSRWQDEAKLIFPLSFGVKYLTPKIGLYIKLKLLMSCIQLKNSKTFDYKKSLKQPQHRLKVLSIFL